MRRAVQDEHSISVWVFNVLPGDARNERGNHRTGTYGQTRVGEELRDRLQGETLMATECP
jgi:hypothetical protein